MSSEEKLVSVKACGLTEAGMIQEMLENNGIECTALGEAAAATIPATSDLDEVRIMVREEDSAAARALIDAYFSPVGKDELSEAETQLGVEDPDEPGGFTR